MEYHKVLDQQSHWRSNSILQSELGTSPMELWTQRQSAKSELNCDLFLENTDCNEKSDFVGVDLRP
jgi:hypothetical protein